MEPWDPSKSKIILCYGDRKTENNESLWRDRLQRTMQPTSKSATVSPGDGRMSLGGNNATAVAIYLAEKKHE